MFSINQNHQESVSYNDSTIYSGRFSINQNHQESVSLLLHDYYCLMFSINQNHQESVSTSDLEIETYCLALIKITKSPYQGENEND